jgi:hypothetical protein
LIIPTILFDSFKALEEIIKAQNPSKKVFEGIVDNFCDITIADTLD